MSSPHAARPAVTARLAGVAALALASALPATAATGGSADAATAHGSAPRPNVVVILADDLGWGDPQPSRFNDGNGSDFNETPAINRLAEEGTSFDNAYASLNCAPTRMALLSGLYATHAENNVYTVDDLNRGVPDSMLYGPPQGRPSGAPVLGNSTRTVAETMQGAGYRTGYIGKFQVTRDADAITRDHGFDENLGGSGSGFASDYFANDGTFNDSIGPGLDRFAGDYTQSYVDDDIAPYSSGVSKARLDALVDTPKNVTDAVGDATIDFVDRNDDRPFLAWMSTYAVHSPTDAGQARPDLLAKYRAKRAGKDPSVPSYAALVEGLDQSVARVVEHLETTPDPRNPGHELADNTLVVFTSDNGGMLAHGAWNGTLSGQKSELLEGGVRVPWVVWSANPALVRGGGTVNHSVINSTDLYPTLASYAGAALPAHEPLDGTDLQPAFEHLATVDRPRFAHFPGYHVEGTREQLPQSYVRDGPWKLTYGYEDQSISLHDLSTDLGEHVDVAAEHPELVARLGQELVDWLASTDSPLATLREGHDPVPVPVPAGATTYADGKVSEHPQASTLVVRAGDQMPLVLAPQTGG